MREFYRKWINWARENHRFAEYTRPITDRVGNYIVDGFSRIHENRGQLFLFNPSPKSVLKRLTLDENIGVESGVDFYLELLYSDALKDMPEVRRFYGGDINTGYAGNRPAALRQ